MERKVRSGFDLSSRDASAPPQLSSYPTKVLRYTWFQGSGRTDFHDLEGYVRMRFRVPWPTDPNG